MRSSSLTLPAVGGCRLTQPHSVLRIAAYILASPKHRWHRLRVAPLMLTTAAVVGTKIVALLFNPATNFSYAPLQRFIPTPPCGQCRARLHFGMPGNLRLPFPTCKDRHLCSGLQSERAAICRHPPTHSGLMNARTYACGTARLNAPGASAYSQAAPRCGGHYVKSKPEQPPAQGERGSGDSLDKPAANSLSATPTPPVRSLFRLGLHSLLPPRQLHLPQCRHNALRTLIIRPRCKQLP